jgi:hypothetical protein
VPRDSERVEFAMVDIASAMGLARNAFTVWFLTWLGLCFLSATVGGNAAGFTPHDAFSVHWAWGRAARCGA